MTKRNLAGRAAIDRTVSVTELLASPSQFDNCRVTVVGWFVYQLEQSALYASSEDARTRDNRIWLNDPAVVHGEKYTRSLSRSWISVCGTYRNHRKAGCGHFGVYPGELRNLLAIDQVGDPKQVCQVRRVNGDDLNPGLPLTVIGRGVASGEDAAVLAARAAVADAAATTDLNRLAAVTLVISGDEELTVAQVNEAAELVAAHLHHDVALTFKAGVNPGRSGQVEITLAVPASDDS